MNGLQFEHCCAKLLQYRGFRKITITKCSGDQGVDIIAQKNGLRYAIQCKYYDRPVGNKAVQEAYSGAEFYDCDAAIVMTNNSYTRAARELADKLNVTLWENCSPSMYSPLITKLMQIIYTLFLFIAFGCIIGTLVYDYPKGSLINYMAEFMLLSASILGIIGWQHRHLSLVSGMLYLGVFLIEIMPHILTSTYSFYELFLLIPVIVTIFHSVYMRFKANHICE